MPRCSCGVILPDDKKGKCGRCGGPACKPDFFANKPGWKIWIACFADGSAHEKYKVQMKDMEQNQIMINQGRLFQRFTTQQLETWKKFKDGIKEGNIIDEK